MKKIKLKKTHILIAVYIILIITELFLFVPYHRIKIFVTNNNVPHTEIIGSGYASIDDIERDVADLSHISINGTKYTDDEEKKVNTPQLFMNVSITTVLSIAIYFLFRKNDEAKRNKSKAII